MSKEELNIVHFASEYTGKFPGSSYSPRGGLGVLVGDLAREQAKNHQVIVYFPQFIKTRRPSRSDGYVKLDVVTSPNSQFQLGDVGSNIEELPESYDAVLPESYTKEFTNFIRNFEIFDGSALKLLVTQDKESPIDVVHFHDWHFGRLAERVRRARDDGELNKNLRIVSTVHNALYQGNVPLTDEYMRELGFSNETTWEELKRYVHKGNFSFLKSLVHFSDKAVTVSHGYAAQINKYGSPDGFFYPNKLDVVENGLDFEAIGHHEMVSPETIRKLRGKSRKPILTVASRLVKEKGIESIVGALPKLTDLFEVHIVGRTESDDLNKKLTSDESIKCHGYMDRGSVIDLLKRSSVFLAPYTDIEPFGIVPIEALACGAVPVVSNVGGMSDNFVDIEKSSKGNAIVISEINNSSINDNGDFSDAIVKSAERAHFCVDHSFGCFAGAGLINNGLQQIADGKWSIEKCAKGYEEVYVN